MTSLRSTLSAGRSRVEQTDLGQDLAALYRRLRRPRAVTLYGVRLQIDPAWPSDLISGIYRGWYEVPEARVLRATLRPEDRYFEVGASLGVMMTIACGIVGDARVTAVEANPRAIPVATDVARRNGFSPEIVHAVLGDDDRPHPFWVLDRVLDSSLTPTPGAEEVSVPGRSFTAELERCAATYLMIDIEGGEIELLDRSLPAGVRAICMEVHPAIVGHAAVQRLLQGLMAQGFVLDTTISGAQVVFLSRDAAGATGSAAGA